MIKRLFYLALRLRGNLSVGGEQIRSVTSVLSNWVHLFFLEFLVEHPSRGLGDACL